MDRLVIQMGVKHGRVSELTRSVDGRLRVGRSLDNELVLNDRYVAPRQLAFEQEDEQWTMRILDRTNPVMLNNRAVVEDKLRVRSGDKVTVGRTQFALCSTADPVEPASKMLLSNWLAGDAGFLLPLFILVAVCLIDLLLTYFLQSSSLLWQEDVRLQLMTMAMIFIWAALWAVTGRIVRQQAHMGLQLVATTFAYGVALILSLSSTVLAAGGNSIVFDQWLQSGSLFVVLVILLRLNLLIATNLQRTLPLAVFLAAMTVGIPYLMKALEEPDTLTYKPEFPNTVVPPVVQWERSVSSEAFFQRASEVVLAAPNDDE